MRRFNLLRPLVGTELLPETVNEIGKLIEKKEKESEEEKGMRTFGHRIYFLEVFGRGILLRFIFS